MAQITLPAPEPKPLLHVDQLSDSQIDSLIDLHLFGHNPVCKGPSQFQYSGMDRAMYHCTLCGAAAERRVAGQYFDYYEHPRQIPRYTIDNLLSAMRLRDNATRYCFSLALTAGIHRAPLAHQITAILTDLTARKVAVAALKALNVLDAQGAILVRI